MDSFSKEEWFPQLWLESHIDKLIGDRDPKSFLPDASILTFERK